MPTEIRFDDSLINDQTSVLLLIDTLLQLAVFLEDDDLRSSFTNDVPLSHEQAYVRHCNAAPQFSYCSVIQ